jgi:hypothetical protein
VSRPIMVLVSSLTVEAGRVPVFTMATTVFPGPTQPSAPAPSRVQGPV